ncbi:RNA-directed DNA polymerase, eukaryota [Tanacetum coccineum]|uniref:RNA-directed DNA polymerase, eukaryota n=1 Tax=Tanacetum coccineum TaxID=301880 RepID=A0ABQ5A492_9ASTR
MNGPHPTSQHPNSKNLHHISITIFVTNFPTTVSSKDLWKLCDRQGVVADVYIARKLSKSGRRFGFVRFIKNPDQANLLEDLNKIWIGSHHLFASIARFDRKQNSQPNSIHHDTIGITLNLTKRGTQKPVLAGPITKNITLENSDLLELSDTSSVVLAKMDAHRHGLLYAFKKIAGNWGETVFVDEDADENIANGRRVAGNDQDIHSIKRVTRRRGDQMIRRSKWVSKLNAPDCSNNVTEECGVVNNNGFIVEGTVRFLEDHFDVMWQIDSALCSISPGIDLKLLKSLVLRA